MEQLTFSTSLISCAGSFESVSSGIHRRFSLPAAVPVCGFFDEFVGDAVKDTLLDIRICAEWITLFLNDLPSLCVSKTTLIALPGTCSPLIGCLI